MSALPNENGVYEPCERLTLLRDVKGWCGSATAEIELLDLGTHWIWSADFQLMSGDHWGAGSPLLDRVDRRAAIRDAAIDAASDHLREKMAPRTGEYLDARRIIMWLDGLHPDQFDLFGAAA